MSKRPGLVRDASSLPNRLEGISRVFTSFVVRARGGTEAIAYMRIHLRAAFPDILWLTD